MLQVHYCERSTEEEEVAEETPVVAVIGASGAQGGSVGKALVARRRFRVRALTRNPDGYAGPADEAVAADLDRPETLAAAFAGAYGVFCVTNFWQPGTDEGAQVRAAVEAARGAGVQHFIWSTLPDVEALSGGQFHVPHFTEKARADQIVQSAGFPATTFVEAPFYFENLTHNMAPQSLPDGRKGWALPLPPEARVVHMATIADLGGVVAGAFEHPERVGDGAHLSAARLMSFGDVAAVLNAQGHDFAVMQVPAEVFAGFFPGAEEIAQMMGYWQQYTYLGPGAEQKIALAEEVSTTAVTDFADWARTNMPVSLP
jgi:uncharacterized protein YbjT (DUF2867 family)